MQFDWFLSVLEQKRLENHKIYSIGVAELPLRFTHCPPLLGWRYLYSLHKLLQSRRETKKGKNMEKKQDDDQTYFEVCTKYLIQN